MLLTKKKIFSAQTFHLYSMHLAYQLMKKGIVLIRKNNNSSFY